MRELKSTDATNSGMINESFSWFCVIGAASVGGLTQVQLDSTVVDVVLGMFGRKYDGTKWSRLKFVSGAVTLLVGTDEQVVHLQSSPAAGPDAGAGPALGNPVRVAGVDASGTLLDLPVVQVPSSTDGIGTLIVGGADGNPNALQLPLGINGQAGSAPGPGVILAGVDSTQTPRHVLVDSGQALIVAPQNTFNVENAPAAATQATVAQAAPGANLKNVVTDIEIEVAAGATASGILTCTITCGAFTKTFRLQAAINGIDRVVLSGLGWRMPANTATTIAFTGAGPAGTFQKVSMSGYVGN